MLVQGRRRLSQPRAFQVPQDLGTSFVKTMAPEPQGSMAQDHLMTTETHDKDLIHFPAPKMNNHEVPFFFRFPFEQSLKGTTKWIETLWNESVLLAFLPTY